MLQVQLHKSTPNNAVPYEEAITLLASKTVVFYSGTALSPYGVNEPSYDISQVCCWISGQPLRNGMRLCAVNYKSEIELIEEPLNEVADTLTFENRPSFSIDNLFLISPDCHEGLRNSLNYLRKEYLNGQKLIKDPQAPNQYVIADPLNIKYYILPKSTYGSDKKYCSQDCFIYSKKTALVTQLELEEQLFLEGHSLDLHMEPELESNEDVHMGIEDKEDSDAEPQGFWNVTSQEFKEFLFVEANPALPKDLYVMAENTIRLFRLNSRHYDHFNNASYHCIEYKPGENEYDDLRFEGRMQAYDRARKSLHQLKSIRNLVVDPGTMRVFISQYRILMELTGYASVWATVFNDGNDPGGFNDIMGVSAPVPPDFPIPADELDNPGMQGFYNIEEEAAVIDLLEDTSKKMEEDNEIADEVKIPLNRDAASKVIKRVAGNDNNWSKAVDGVIKKRKDAGALGVSIDNLAILREIIIESFSFTPKVQNMLLERLNELAILYRPEKRRKIK